MREAAETLDDVTVRDGVTQHIIGLRKSRERRHQRARMFLVRERLAVLEGQIEEDALDGQATLVVAALDGQARRLQRERIGGKRTRLAAKHLPGELVEHDDAGEATLRIVEPIGIAGESFIQWKEALCDLAIKGPVFLEPALVTFAMVRTDAKPELEHVLGAVVAHYH